MNPITTIHAPKKAKPTSIQPTHQPKVFDIRLENVISPEVKIKDAVSESGPAFDGLLQAFSTWSPVDKEVKFTYEKRAYRLKSSQDENGNEILNLSDSRGNVQVKLKRTSLEKLASRLTLISLFKQLDEEAKSAFKPLFDTEPVGKIDADSPFVIGDLDGSTARQIVSGIQTGHIDIDSEGLTLLAEIMNAEAEVLKKLQSPRVYNPLQVLGLFQTNGTFQGKIEELAQHLTYKKGHTPLICIGDGAHDRISCNKDADREIREKLHEQGVVFILGNHDVFFTRKFGDLHDPDTMHIALSFGAGAKNETPDVEWKAHQDRVFVHAYYHKETNKIYSHHGFEVNRAGQILTAFGTAAYTQSISTPNFDKEKFVEWVNAQPRPLPESMVKREEWESNYNLDERLTRFRPDDKGMEKIADALGCGFVHGHDGERDISSEKVIVLNARQEGKPVVVAARIGRPESKEIIAIDKKRLYPGFGHYDFAQQEKRSRLEAQTKVH